MTDNPIDHLEVYRDAAGETRWRAIARNGRIIAVSGEGFENRADAVDIVSRLFPGDEIRETNA